jgi:hypothetical protein
MQYHRILDVEDGIIAAIGDYHFPALAKGRGHDPAHIPIERVCRLQVDPPAMETILLKLVADQGFKVALAPPLRL